jgi:hypothetical protein
LSGKETNLAFLNEKNPDIVKVYPPESGVDNPKSDIRLAVIKYLEGGSNNYFRSQLSAFEVLFISFIRS